MKKRKSKFEPAARRKQERVNRAAPELPLEIWHDILGRLPPYPRLNVASLVCKQWRAIVLRTYTRLLFGPTSHLQVPFTAALRALFPSLTAVKVPLSATEYPAPPNNLRSLTLECLHQAFPLPMLPRGLVKLSLKLASPRVTLITPLLRATAASLRSLNIVIQDGWEVPEPADLPPDLVLPRLDSLKIVAPIHWRGWISRLVSRFVSQLTKKFTLWAGKPVDSQWYYQRFLTLPALVPTLKLRIICSDTYFPEDCLPFLRHLECSVSRFSRLLTWKSWPLLRSLRLSTITELFRDSFEEALQVKESFPCLEFCSFGRLFFPHNEMVVRTVTALLRAAPRLLDVELFLPPLQSDADLAAFSVLLRHSEQQGLQRFRVTYRYVEECRAYRRALLARWKVASYQAIVLANTNRGVPDVVVPFPVWYAQICAIARSFRWMQVKVTDNMALEELEADSSSSSSDSSSESSSLSYFSED